MITNLLVPIDFSDTTDRVFACAEELAQQLHAKIWLMHCVREHAIFAAMEEVPLVLPGSDVTASERYPEQFRQLLKLGEYLNEKGINAETLFVTGLPSDEIVFIADHYLMDLIVMGSHGHGALYEAVAGSVTTAVLQQTNRPCMIIPSHLRTQTAGSDQWEEPMATPY